MYKNSSGHKIPWYAVACVPKYSEMAARWAAGLCWVGLYFEGFVNDAPAVLEEYYKETVTSFGVHNSSRKCHSQL